MDVSGDDNDDDNDGEVNGNDNDDDNDDDTMMTMCQEGEERRRLKRR